LNTLEEVEKLRAKLQIDLFGKARIFDCCKVPLFIPAARSLGSTRDALPKVKATGAV
jgi:hypothetical protein